MGSNKYRQVCQQQPAPTKKSDSKINNDVDDFGNHDNGHDDDDDDVE